jgi:CubicO group peptidase (beta-lactamase class C family)
LEQAFHGQAFSRRALVQGGAAGALVGALGESALAHQATPGPGAARDPAASILDLAREALDAHDLKAVILRVEVDGQEVVTAALGESMTGVPATIDMHFRNGAVAVSYMATLLLQLVDDGVVSLDDPIAAWLPNLPEADQVTLRMLANMTAGYPDFVPNPGFETAIYADPFQQWTAEELIAIGLSTPRRFAPGANWDYSHTNYVILGQALEVIADRPLDTLMNERIFAPLGLTNTRGWATPEIPEPVLHAFSAERHEALGIPAGVPFYEETTFWNPSWTLAPGAVQTTDIVDMAASAVAVGEGTLLSPESHRAQIAPDLLGFGSPLEGCPACHTLDEA